MGTPNTTFVHRLATTYRSYSRAWRWFRK